MTGDSIAVDGIKLGKTSMRDSDSVEGELVNLRTRFDGVTKTVSQTDIYNSSKSGSRDDYSLES
jgi:hypothetical protein